MIFGPAYAKLNLALSVVGRRADGRHDLRSVVAHLDWHDLVGVAVREGERVAVTTSGPGAEDVPGDGGNLAVRAAAALLAAFPDHGLRLHLEKRLPAAAGLGGGSADAAAVLRLLSVQLPGGTWDGAALLDIGDSLGSDVPACVAGGSLLVGGAGERLERLHHPGLHMAVAVAASSSTAETFAALDSGEWRGPERPEALARALSAGAAPDPRLCGSDLEAAACRANPQLARALNHLREGVPEVVWHLTGSGGACFALAGGAAHAARLAAAAGALGFPARPCRTVGAEHARLPAAPR